MNYKPALDSVRWMFWNVINFIIAGFFVFGFLCMFYFYGESRPPEYPPAPGTWPGHGISSWIGSFDYADWMSSLRLNVRQKQVLDSLVNARPRLFDEIKTEEEFKKFLEDLRKQGQ